MRRYCINKTVKDAVRSLLVVAAVLFYVNIGSAADIEVQSGFNYDFWVDNKDNEATQVYIPVKIDFYSNNYSFGLLTGWANTDIELTDNGTSTLSNTLDTKINFSFEISKGLPFNILLGLDVNLPTGKTDFEQEELIIIMDPDLVSISNFGEGYNINPTLAVAKEWGGLVAGLGVGYLWRNEYDFSESVNDYDPGDIINTSAEVRYFFSSVWNARLFGNYVLYGEDKVESEDFFQEGDYYQLGLKLNYNRTKWHSGLTLGSIFREKSSTQDAGGGLSTENNKSRGDEWVGDLTLSYLINDGMTLKSFLQGLYISENDYPADASRFVGSREKYTLGFGASSEFTRWLEGGVMLKGFIMRDEEANFPEPRTGRNYKGFSLIVKLTTKFSGI